MTELSDKELIEKCENAFSIASSMMYDPEIDAMKELFHRFRHLTESKPSVDEIVEAIDRSGVIQHCLNGLLSETVAFETLRTAIESVVNKTNTPTK